MFKIEGKVALITGGNQGIGFSYAKSLLKHGAKGVTIADINPSKGKSAVEELTRLNGEDKAQFIQTDVADIKQFEEAFKKTIEKFGHVDILINNAGIANESNWEKVIQVNFIGTVNGILLGLENYLKNYRSGEEAVILSTSSQWAFSVPPCIPIYAGTKAAINAITLSWGHKLHYERTKVRVLSLCPGATSTEILNLDSQKNFLSPEYGRIFDGIEFDFQEADFVGDEGVKLIQNAPNGTIWIVGQGKPAVEYRYLDKEIY